MKLKTNRRRFVRYTLEPMYAPIAARLLSRDKFHMEGHAYDISEGGMRFELDRALDPGTEIAVRIGLPGCVSKHGTQQPVYAMARVTRVEDADDPGPVRTAAVFTGFPRAADRERLLKQFAAGRFRLAA